MRKKSGKVYEAVTRILRNLGADDKDIEVVACGRSTYYMVLRGEDTLGEFNRISGMLSLYPIDEAYEEAKRKDAEEELRRVTGKDDERKPCPAIMRKMYAGFGEEHYAAEWARLLGLPRNTVWRNLCKGRTVEEIAGARGIKYPKR